MATVTVGTTPVQLDDGTSLVVHVGNTGHVPVTLTGPADLGGGRVLQPFSSTDVRPRSVALVAATTTGTTSLAVSTVDPSPGTGGGGGGSGDFADRLLSNLADLVAARLNLGLGSAAQLNVGTTNGTVASGGDARFTDARTPTAHAASHASGGPDALALAISQITGLTPALAGKADLVAGKVPTAQLPPLVINDTHTVASEAEMLALTAAQGDVAIRTDFDPARFYWLSQAPASTLANWTPFTVAAGVTSVAGKTGTVALVVADIGGLQAALDAKATTTLSNVDPATARTRLALGSAAQLNVGTGAGTVAAGNDSRFTDQRTPLDGSVTITKLAANVADLLATDPAFTSRYEPLGGPIDEIDWASGAFLRHDATQVTSFGAFRDRPVQVIAHFPSHNTLSEIQNPWYMGSAFTPSGYTGDISLAVPMCADGQTVAQNISTQITNLANLLNAYPNRFFLRIGWEMNLPQWTHRVTDANLTTWRSRFSAYADIFHSIMGAKAVVVFNPNIGGNQFASGDGTGLHGSIEQAFVAGKVDAVGPDIYDCYPPFTTDGNVNTHLTRDQGLDWWADFAETHDVGLCLPEWGVSSGTQWAGNCGNDNPRYITEMVAWMKRNRSRMLFDAYFNENEDYVESDIFAASGSSNNPLSAARYAQLYAQP